MKPKYLAKQGHEVINPALDDDDFAKAVEVAQAEFDKHCPEVIVGSTRGGSGEIGDALRKYCRSLHLWNKLPFRCGLVRECWLLGNITEAGRPAPATNDGCVRGCETHERNVK